MKPPSVEVAAWGGGALLWRRSWECLALREDAYWNGSLRAYESFKLLQWEVRQSLKVGCQLQGLLQWG
ncbi:hypothetical protein [Bartonella jaculi]|uniref:Uncharacterized protein n=1 Tax=Bartonella jaculi TaxID=686226 RepID=A0ABP9N860_9HYPH